MLDADSSEEPPPDFTIPAADLPALMAARGARQTAEDAAYTLLYGAQGGSSAGAASQEVASAYSQHLQGQYLKLQPPLVVDVSLTPGQLVRHKDMPYLAACCDRQVEVLERASRRVLWTGSVQLVAPRSWGKSPLTDAHLTQARAELAVQCSQGGQGGEHHLFAWNRAATSLEASLLVQLRQEEEELAMEQLLVASQSAHAMLQARARAAQAPQPGSPPLTKEGFAAALRQDLAALQAAGAEASRAAAAGAGAAEEAAPFDTISPTHRLEKVVAHRKERSARMGKLAAVGSPEAGKARVALFSPAFDKAASAVDANAARKLQPSKQEVWKVVPVNLDDPSFVQPTAGHQGKEAVVVFGKNAGQRGRLVSTTAAGRDWRLRLPEGGELTESATSLRVKLAQAVGGASEQAPAQVSKVRNKVCPLADMGFLGVFECAIIRTLKHLN